MNSAQVDSYKNLGVIITFLKFIHCTVIKFENHITRYDHNDDNDFQYHDSLNVRVSKNVFNIVFWKFDIEILIDNDRNWRILKNFWAIIHIDINQNIKTNEVKLITKKND